MKTKRKLSIKLSKVLTLAVLTCSMSAGVLTGCSSDVPSETLSETPQSSQSSSKEASSSKDTKTSSKDSEIKSEDSKVDSEDKTITEEPEESSWTITSEVMEKFAEKHGMELSFEYQTDYNEDEDDLDESYIKVDCDYAYEDRGQRYSVDGLYVTVTSCQSTEAAKEFFEHCIYYLNEAINPRSYQTLV